ncbi:unnamed protein product [Porites lobata]|uniref:PH domain-containing protein n=1 Tax=Porites lobata TaxID=104759 RepID=A0ABN8PE21_9CNID|nr:unnamed protein product [Porites lobata]
MENPLHEDFLKKEEEKERWIEYWAVLRNSVLYFYDEQTDICHEYCDKIELTPDAKCFTVRRKTYSHRFKLITDEGAWLLKCHTNIQRHRWMHAIELAVRQLSSETTEIDLAVGVPRRPYSHCYEKDLLGRRDQREARKGEAAATACESNNNSTLEELSMNLKLEQRENKSFSKTRASRKNFKAEKPRQFKDKHKNFAFETLQCENSTNSDLGIPVENLGFSDDETSTESKEKTYSGSDIPVAKLIQVEPK